MIDCFLFSSAVSFRSVLLSLLLLCNGGLCTTAVLHFLCSVFDVCMIYMSWVCFPFIGLLTFPSPSSTQVITSSPNPQPPSQLQNQPTNSLTNSHQATKSPCTTKAPWPPTAASSTRRTTAGSRSRSTSARARSSRAGTRDCWTCAPARRGGSRSSPSGRTVVGVWDRFPLRVF